MFGKLNGYRVETTILFICRVKFKKAASANAALSQLLTDLVDFFLDSVDDESSESSRPTSGSDSDELSESETSRKVKTVPVTPL